MATRNEYFADEISRLADDDFLPNLMFYKRGTSPIAEPGGHRKQVLVFEQGVNFNGTFAEGDDAPQVSRLTKRDYINHLAAHTSLRA